MTNRKVILTVVLGLLVLTGTLFYLKVGWVILGQEDLDYERMGYCFDTATDRAGNRLFVAAGKSGLHIFDLDEGTLKYLATYYDDGYYRNIKVQGERAYLADGYRGLVVFDVAGELPVTTWVQAGVKAGGIYVEGTTAYLAAFEDGLQIFDISTPDTPVLLSTLKIPGSAWDVWVHAGYAFIASLDEGMIVADVSSPTKPRYIGASIWAKHHQNAEIIRGEGNVVYIAAANHGLIIVDISDPVRPVVASRYRPIRVSFAEGLAISDGTAYVAMGSGIGDVSTIENGLHILDVTDPYSPRLLGKVSFRDWPEGVHIAGGFAYVANTWTGVRSIDIHNPVKPFLADTFNAFP